MNDNTQMTSAPGSSLIPESTSVITTMHLAIIAIFAVLVIIGILWGMRLKRARKDAEREVAEDNANIGATSHAAGEQTGAGKPALDIPTRETVAPPTPVPTAPTPPPAVDGPAVGTPPPAPSIDDEPVAATAPLDASPASEAESASASAATDAIPVTTLKGLGPKVAARLADLGITDTRQLAALNDYEAAKLDADLGSFAGRMARDRWIEQARLLSAGDRAGYEATFGKL